MSDCEQTELKAGHAPASKLSFQNELVYIHIFMDDACGEAICEFYTWPRRLNVLEGHSLQLRLMLRSAAVSHHVSLHDYKQKQDYDLNFANFVFLLFFFYGLQ